MISRQFDQTAWSTPPEKPVLAANEVHLWRLELDLPLIAPFRDTLVLSETLQAERMANSVDRRRFVSGCGQLRTILSRYLEMDAGEIPFAYAPSGEPVALRMPHSIHFDWASADHLGLVAVSRIIGLTLEFERVCSGLPVEMLADHFFEPREKWGVRIAPAEERHGQFYRTWTGREAMRRAGGEGATVCEIVPEEGFAAAIAACGEDWKLSCWAP